MERSKKEKLYLILIGVTLLIVAGVVLFGILGQGKTTESNQAPVITAPAQPDVKVVYKETEKMVEVEKEITATVVQDGLRDMGVLVTDEYYFTEVVSFSSVKDFLGFTIGATESAYVAGYDGVVTAGLDFSAITVIKDDSAKTVTIRLPACEILNIDIDPESFVLYSEKSGWGNPVSVQDFNKSLVELENNARTKAIDKGILTRADENARQLISRFVSGLLGDQDYRVEFISG